MSSTRVGINGFGRMGRLALRAAWGWPEFEFAHINELNADAGTAAHLLTFDSIHGRWDREISGDAQTLTVDGAPIGFGSGACPGEVPWDEHGVDVVIEASGKFRTMQALAPYFERGVKTVVVAAPVKEQTALNVIVGVNDDLYDPAMHDVVTAASCTTNCLAPVVKVNASLTDCVFEVARSTSAEEVNALLRAAAEGPFAGILGYEERPLVSVDYKDDPRSGVVDALSTRVIDGTQVKIYAWYDNEWGYANRLAELTRMVSERLEAA